MIKNTILALFIFFCVSSATQSSTILNCPSCSLEREYCKNCKKEKKSNAKPPKSKKLLNKAKVTDSLVCYRYGHYNGKYIKEAQLRNLNCNNQNKLKKKLSFKSNQNPISKKTIYAEEKCIELGFKKATEKFGDCVLKLLDF